MIFRQIFDRVSCTYTYLIGSTINNEAIIIDPVFEQVPLYLGLIEQLNLKLIASLDTHVHADHITGSGALQKQTDCDILMGEHSKASRLSRRLKDGEILTVGDLSIEVLYTPGHTDDSCCFVMSDRVFTGDTLFIKGTGRTDFQNGSAEHQYDSLVHKLLTLPDQTLVYPGHDYKGMTVSTIGEEKQFNPRLQVEDKMAYVQLMDNLNLPNPKLIEIAVPENLNCGYDAKPVEP